MSTEMTRFWKKRARLHRATSSPKRPQTPHCQLPENGHDTEINLVEDVTTMVALLVMEITAGPRGRGVSQGERTDAHEAENCTSWGL